MKVTDTMENGWRTVYDADYQQASSYARDLVKEADLSQWHDKRRFRGWSRASLPWERKEDNLLLRLLSEFAGRGKKNVIELCIAQSLRRTPTSVRTRINALYSASARCKHCGK